MLAVWEARATHGASKSCEENLTCGDGMSLLRISMRVHNMLDNNNGATH
jgi:hypothetical protein